MAGRIEVPVTERHKAIQDFEEYWTLGHKFFSSLDCEPMISSGKNVCRGLLGGRAVFMESELETGYSSIVLTTWNMTKGKYEGIFMDIHSFDGFDPLIGLPVRGFPVPCGSEVDLSDAALLSSGPARDRVWSSRLTVPPKAALVEGADPLLAGVDEMPAEIVEHKISNDKWVLFCSVSRPTTSETSSCRWRTPTRVRRRRRPCRAATVRRGPETAR